MSSTCACTVFWGDRDRDRDKRPDVLGDGREGRLPDVPQNDVRTPLPEKLYLVYVSANAGKVLCA